MSPIIQVGDRVRYRVGRGYGEGRVASIDGDKARISTAKGKMLTRMVSELMPVETAPPQSHDEEE